MLEHDKTLEYIALAKKGDGDAKGKLIEENSSLIKSVIRPFKNKGVEYEDLYQLGCVGFLKAINNFDVKYAVRFSTYAVPMILGEVKRFLRDDGSIKVSRSVKVLSSKINRFIDEYRKKTDRTPEIKEIAEKFGVDQEEVVFALDSGKAPISLYEKDGEDEKSPELIDRLHTDDTTEEVVDRIVVKDMIDKLPDREKKIIILRYFRDKTQGEIARELGVSQVQISRLESKIIEKLRCKI